MTGELSPYRPGEVVLHMDVLPHLDHDDKVTVIRSVLWPGGRHVANYTVETPLPDNAPPIGEALRPLREARHEMTAQGCDELLNILERRGVITTDPERRDECCGLPRDEDGFCTYREGYPIYADPDADR